MRLAGREFRVRFAGGAGGRQFAEIEEGREVGRVEVQAAGSGRLLLDGEPLEVRLDTRGGGSVLHAGGVALQVEVLTEAEAALAAARSSTGGSGRVEVRAPMPGRVLAVEVAEGDAVSEGTGLFIVEAMKMENEIRAAGAGRIRDLRVAAGETVEGDQLLCVIASGPDGEA